MLTRFRLMYWLVLYWTFKPPVRVGAVHLNKTFRLFFVFVTLQDNSFLFCYLERTGELKVFIMLITAKWFKECRKI